MPEDPLYFFDELVVNDGVNQLWKEFIPNEETQRRNGIWIDLERRKKYHSSYNEQNGMAEEPWAEDFVYDFLKKKVYQQKDKSAMQVRQFAYYHSVAELKVFLRGLLIHIDFLISACTENLSYEESQICENGLKDLRNIFQSYLSTTLKKQKPKDANGIPTSFKFRSIKYSDVVLRLIYNELRSLEPYGFINCDLTSPEEFIQLLTSKNLPNEKCKIWLSCENVQAAYIIIKMQPLFNNFTFAEIQRSNKIYRKSGLPFTEDSLSYAKASCPNPKGEEFIDKTFKKIYPNES